MTVLKTKNLNRLPFELVDLIADYHDYDKYCKPGHQILLKNVLGDIKNMSEIMASISPVLAWQCWGPGALALTNSFENENMVGLNDYEYEADMAQFDYEDGIDDEENNFGMDYDDTFYYSN